MTGAVVKMEAVGTKMVGGFRCHSGGSVTTRWEEPTWPPHPEGTALMHARVAAGVGLREFSKRLGLSAEIVSGLEWGRYRFVDAADWDLARALIKEAR